MRTALFVGALVFGAVALAEQPVSGEKAARLMLWHLLPAEGATPELASRIERQIRTLLAEKLPGGGLLDEMAMDSVLLVEGNEKFLRCGLGAVCLAGLGRAAGTERVAAGEVFQANGRMSLRLVLVDSASSKLLCESKVSGFGDLGPGTLEEISVAMLEPERYRGTLELAGGVPGAEVLLDGKRIAVMPLIGPLQDLEAGEHKLEVRKVGYLPVQQAVHIPFGRKQQVEIKMVQLRAAEKRFWQNWPFWTTVGVGAAGIAIGGLLYYDAGVLRDNAHTCEQQHRDCVADYNRRADSRTIQALVMFSFGGAGLAAAAVIAIIDLAQNREEPIILDDVSFSPAPGGGVVSFGVRF